MYFNSVFNLTREALTLILTSYLQILKNEKKNINSHDGIKIKNLIIRKIIKYKKDKLIRLNKSNLHKNISNVVLESPIINKLPMRKKTPSCIAPKLLIPNREQSEIPTTAPIAFEKSHVPRKNPIIDDSQQRGALLPYRTNNVCITNEAKNTRTVQIKRTNKTQRPSLFLK